MAGKKPVGFGVSAKMLPYRWQHVNITARHPAQELRKNRDFFVQTFVFVDQKERFAFNLAQTTDCIDSGSAEILFGDFDTEFFRHFFKLLV